MYPIFIGEFLVTRQIAQGGQAKYEFYINQEYIRHIGLKANLQ